MRIIVSKQDWKELRSDGLIVLLSEDQALTDGQIGLLDQKLGGLLTQLRASREFKGEQGDSLVLFRPRGLDVERFVLAGNGPRADSTFGTIRASVHGAINKLRGFRLERLTVLAPSWMNPLESVQAIAEGIVLSNFTPAEYKTEDRSEIEIGEVVIVVSEDSDQMELEACVERGVILSRAVNWARRLTNEPGNRINPASFAHEAVKMAEECDLQITLLEEPEMEKMGMKAVLAVARGSSHPAKFIVLNHHGSADPTQRPIAFIGKGVTFDSGGISLKPSKSMEEMKADKAGACSVLGAMQAISKLNVPTDVVALLPVVENLPGGKAQRPGDVVQSLSGKTIEVVNTDAEGRLILADALTYAQQEFNPRGLVDLATLTGACVVALGHVRAGLFGNNEDFCADLLRAADRCGERLWRLPLDQEYRKDIESQIADIKNVGNRWGGAIVAAKFLQEFVGDIPWCHIDMAGVDLFHENSVAGGPSGFGVRTLVELALNHRSR